MEPPETETEEISSRLKPILDSIRSEIDEGQTTHEGEDASGWRHGGDAFSKLVDSLRGEIQKDLKRHSLHVFDKACSVRHFFRGAKIVNPFYPTKRLLIIPINGASTLSGHLLPIDTYCYIEDRSALVSGEDIDVVVIGYKVSESSS